MLHLTAMEGDYLMIGDDIKLMFVKQTRSGINEIHIAVVAPRTVPVLRDKIYEQKLIDYANDPNTTPEEASDALQKLEGHREERLATRSKLFRRMSSFNLDIARRLAKEEAECENAEQSKELFQQELSQ